MSIVRIAGVTYLKIINCDVLGEVCLVEDCLL